MVIGLDNIIETLKYSSPNRNDSADSRQVSTFDRPSELQILLGAADIEMELVKPRPTGEASTWLVVDKSEGGLRLLWQLESASRALVGELAILRDAGTNSPNWSLGVDRRLRYHPTFGVEVGIQIISSLVTPISLQFAYPARGNTRVYEGLLVPAETQDDRASFLVTMPDQFHVGDELCVQLLERQINVTLIALISQSSFFNQFTYIDKLQSQQRTNVTREKTDSFDSLWATL